LGGGVIKQRITRSGAGKSGGFRTLILFKIRELAIFVHAFAKSGVEDIRPDELVAVKKLANAMLAYRENELKAAVAVGTLTEVRCNDKPEAVSKQSDGLHPRNG